MTDIVKLLDRYRLSLLDDDVRFFLVSLLFRNGPMSSDELADVLGKIKPELTVLIRELYQAGWISQRSTDLFALTEGSEAVQHSLGMLDLANESLFIEILPDLKDRRELQSWMLSHATAEQKLECHRALQIFRLVTHKWRDVDASIIRRVLHVVLYRRLIGRGLIDSNWSGNSDITELALWQPYQLDVANLANFLKEGRLPTNKTERDVTVLVALITVTIVACNASDDSVLADELIGNLSHLEDIWAQIESNEEHARIAFLHAAAHYVPAPIEAPDLPVTKVLSRVRQDLLLESRQAKRVESRRRMQADLILRFLDGRER